MPWKRQAERMQGSHAGSIHLAGGPEETAAQARPVKQERGGGGGGRRGQEKGRTERRRGGRDEADAQAMQDAQSQDETRDI